MIKNGKKRKKGYVFIHRLRTFCILGSTVCFMALWSVWGTPSLMHEVRAKEQEPEGLYAQSAVLMDANSGRILFSKNGQQERAMASTTKIMTCILALEYGNLDEKVMVSENAASQPKVHLGATKGEEFVLRDLLYSLMLESHNDSAVIIAESVGTSVEGFADMMNKKAEELGCDNTYFITPNGLDAKDEKGSHHTTAEDLAKIMKYCISDSPKREIFLDITRAPSYQFQNCQGTRSYACTNHNAFLQMMEGALSGKTGFTGDAGYCYIGSLKRDDRTFIVALLACGWPNNKGYKWADTKKLMNYGLENYQYENVWQEIDLGTIRVQGGIDRKNPFHDETKVLLEIPDADRGFKTLLGKEEKVEVKWKKEQVIEAPVEKGQKVGEVTYTLNGELLRTFSITTHSAVEKKTLSWYIKTILDIYLVNNSSPTV